MAKDRRKLQHIHSSIPDKQPTPASLEVGEIAVNNAANQEFLSIKNSDDVVKRFSSDEQIITWMERKEVMPYEGYTRGADGPAGSTGPNSVTNDDLLQNKSNLIIKLNQVAASNTVKHNKVNGAKDIYGKCVNPTTDSGVTDGAGFAIDMSRYAMMDANPSFSAATVSAQTNLSGNTYITNGASANTYGTDTGHTLTITTTDVVDTNTNWTETITNKKSTVTNETDKITTLNESATTRNTTVGTETLHVSGTTTETHDKNVTITNNSGVTETTKGKVVENISGTTTITRTGTVTEDNKNNVTRTTSGTTTETFKGQVTENNQSGYTVNTTGNVIVNTTGTTTETKIGNVTENHSGTTVENNNGDVTVNNLSNKTENTTGSHSMYSTGDTCVNSQASANFYGKGSTNIGVACDGTTKGSATTVYGTTTTISANTLNETSAGNTNINVGGNLVENVTGTTTVNRTGAVTENNSGGLTIATTGKTCMQSTTDVNIGGDANTNIGVTCEGGVYSNNVGIYAQTAITETADTVYISGTSSVNISGGTSVCISGGTNSNIYAPTTNVGISCGNSSATTVNVSGATVNEGGTTNNNNFTTINNTATTINNNVTNYNITGTTYISGNTTISGDVTIGDDLTIPIPCNSLTSTTVNAALCEVFDRSEVTMTREDAPSDGRLSAIYRLWQNNSQIGYDINVPKDGFLKEVKLVDVGNVWYLRFTWNVYDAETETYSTGSTDVNVEDLVKDIEANNTNTNRGANVGVWYNSTSGKMNVSADTTIKIASASGDKTFTKTDGNHSLTTYKLSYSHNGYSGEFDPFNANSSFTSPHSALSFSYGSVASKSGSDSYNTSADKSITIPTSIDHLSNWNGTCINLPHDVCVTGTITASGAIYSSDKNLKENIVSLKGNKSIFDKAADVDVVSFNFKDDEKKNTKYGVIAQDVQKAGLDELVYENNGNLGVDYTSLLMLKIAYLENTIKNLTEKIEKLENK